MRMPTESDINVHDSLDERVARDHFLGKTVEEAEALFRENSAYYQEDLMWMGPRAFAYYLQSVVNYLKSEHAAEDDHFIDSLHSLVMFRSDEEEFSLAVKPLRELVDYVINNYEKFAVDHEIYGDVLAKYQKLQASLERM